MAETFGTWLKHRRLEQNLSQAGLAERGDMKRATVSLYEKDGIAHPKMAQLDKLAKGLGVSKDDVRAAFAARTILGDQKLVDEESVEIGKGVRVVFNLKDAKLTTEDTLKFISAMKLVLDGLRSRRSKS